MTSNARQNTSMRMNEKELDFTRRYGQPMGVQVREDQHTLQALLQVGIIQVQKKLTSTSIDRVLDALKGLVFVPEYCDQLPKFIYKCTCDYYKDMVQSAFNTLDIANLQKIDPLEAYALFHLARLLG